MQDYTKSLGSEDEARVLIPVIESLLSALRGSTNESL